MTRWFGMMVAVVLLYESLPRDYTDRIVAPDAAWWVVAPAASVICGLIATVVATLLLYAIQKIWIDD